MSEPTKITRALDAYKDAWSRYKLSENYTVLRFRPTVESYLREYGCFPAAMIRNQVPGNSVYMFFKQHVGELDHMWTAAARDLWFDREEDARVAEFYTG